MRAAPTLVLAAMALLASSCQPAFDGHLEPVSAPGITIVRDGDGNRAARLRHGRLTVIVSGKWGNQREEAFTLTYRNAGPAVTLDGSLVRLRRPAGSPGDLTVTSMRGEDYRTARTLVDFNQPRDRRVTIPTGDEIQVFVSFDDGWGTPDLVEGDRVRLLVPLGEQGQLVTLTARKPWLRLF